MDIIEFECLEFRFDELYRYCSFYDKSNILYRGMKMSDVFLIDIACFLLYLSPSSRKLLNNLYLFRDAMDCNRLVVEKLIEIVSDNLSFTENHFGKPCVMQILSNRNTSESERYVSLFSDFFRMLGNAVIREQIK